MHYINGLLIQHFFIRSIPVCAVVIGQTLRPITSHITYRGQLYAPVFSFGRPAYPNSSRHLRISAALPRISSSEIVSGGEMRNAVSQNRNQSLRIPACLNSSMMR